MQGKTSFMIWPFDDFPHKPQQVDIQWVLPRPILIKVQVLILEGNCMGHRNRKKITVITIDCNCIYAI